MAKLHEYPTTVAWTGGRDGRGTSTSDRTHISYPLSTPPEFGGPGQGTNPEELLASAVASCYSITYGIIANNRKIPLVGIVTNGTGEVEENGPQFTYKKVTLVATITLGGDATDEQMKLAEDMAHKADAYCIITNAIRDKVEIIVQPTIIRA